MTENKNSTSLASGQRTIFLVEDSPTQALKMRALLQKADMDVVVAHSGKEALDKIDVVMPDLILLDMQLPDIDGRELALHFRQKSRLSHIPIIFITAVFKQVADVVSGLSELADDYILKNVADQEMVARINATLRASENQRELNRLTRLLLTVNQVGSQMHDHFSLDNILIEIIELVQRTFHVDYVNIYGVANQELSLIGANGNEADIAIAKQAEYRLDSEIPAATTARAGKTRVWVLGKPLTHPFLTDAHFILTIPILDTNKVVGLLEIANRKKMNISRYDRVALSTLTDLLAVAFRNDKLLQSNTEVAAGRPSNSPLNLPNNWIGKLNQSGTILMIEDSLVQAMHTKRILEKNGFKVDHYTEGKAVLNYLKTKSPDLILLDLQLPDMNSRDLVPIIKANGLWAGIPVVLITGIYRDVADLVTGLESGADDYLIKPVEDEALVARVRATLRAKNIQRELGRLANMLLMVNQIGQKLAGQFNLQELLQHAVDLTHNNLRYQFIHLYLIEEDQLRLAALSGDPADRIKEVSGTFSWRHFMAFASVVESKFTGIYQFAENQHPVNRSLRSSILAPLIVNNVAVGLFEIGFADSEDPGLQDDLVIQTLADLISVAIYNSRLFKQVEDLAEKDSLTGLWNKRAFLKKLEKSWSVSLQEQQPLVIAMIDIDFFKMINDRFGHLVGDRTLQKLAGFMLEQLPEDAILSRYGGEEFVVLFANYALEDAAMICEQLLKECGKLPFQSMDGEHFQITISIGVAERIALQATALLHLLHRADSALYEAKANGRNRLEKAVLDG